MEVLLIGGPKNGTVLHIKAGVSILIEHDGKRYAYRKQAFTFPDSGINAVWEIWVNGDLPEAEDIFVMIQDSGIHPIQLTGAMSNETAPYILDRISKPPICLPIGLDRGNLVDITRLGDAWRRYLDTQTGKVIDGAECWAMMQRRAGL